jgi:hypothetical protein
LISVDSARALQYAYQYLADALQAKEEWLKVFRVINEDQIHIEVHPERRADLTQFEQLNLGRIEASFKRFAKMRYGDIMQYILNDADEDIRAAQAQLAICCSEREAPEPRTRAERP